MKQTTRIVVVMLLFVFFSSPRPSFASVVINEFSSDTEGVSQDPDWIELYNNTSDSVDLTQYKIRDDSSTNRLELTGTINGNGYVVIEWGNKLNKTGDTITLFRKDDESQIIDFVSYGDSQNAVVQAPVKNGSAGRKQDNAGEWVVFTTVTKGSSNNTGTIALPPTGTPTTQPTPTKTLTPTKTPTPQKAPTSTKTPTPAKSLQTSIKQPTATRSQGSGFSSVAEDKAVLAGATRASSAAWENQPTAILENTEIVEEENAPKDVLVKSANTFPIVELVLFGGAGICIGCAILIFLKQRKKVYAE